MAEVCQVELRYEILLAQVEVTNKRMSRKFDNGVGKKLS